METLINELKNKITEADPEKKGALIASIFVIDSTVKLLLIKGCSVDDIKMVVDLVLKNKLEK